MDVYREGSQIKAYGFDRAGERYCAATVSLTDSDWRRTLLIKLREGDWQSETTVAEKTMAANLKLEADNNKVKNDRIAEIADKFASAVARDNNSKRIF